MTIQKLINRIDTFDDLIKQERTGTPEEIAKKLGLSRRQFFRFKDDLEKSGVKIKYSKIKESYYYTGKQIHEVLLS